jgi:CheY-like chemotaxis protein/anti-sigma regulatory factor (Ser/Thr protein kinase)
MDTAVQTAVPLRLLLVEDSPADAKLLLRYLRQGGFDPVFLRVETHAELVAALRTDEWDLVISDYRMPNFSGPEALTVIKSLRDDLPFIIVSGTVGEESAVDAMRAGASDYVMKNNLLRLGPAIRREVQESRNRKERRRAEAEREQMEMENERLVMEKAVAAVQQRAFLKDVLYSVTERRLHLCDTPDELPSTLSMRFEGCVTITAPSLCQMRRATREAACGIGLPDERCSDLVTAVGEVGMNAVVHAGGGEARIFTHTDSVQVWIEDKGRGIDVADLPKATLERGYTTANSLGHGFFIALKLADQIYLLTGSSGTTAVVVQYSRPPEPAWAQFERLAVI